MPLISDMSDRFKQAGEIALRGMSSAARRARREEIQGYKLGQIGAEGEQALTRQQAADEAAMTRVREQQTGETARSREMQGTQWDIARLREGGETGRAYLQHGPESETARYHTMMGEHYKGERDWRERDASIREMAARGKIMSDAQKYANDPFDPALKAALKDKTPEQQAAIRKQWRDEYVASATAEAGLLPTGQAPPARGAPQAATGGPAAPPAATGGAAPPEQPQIVRGADGSVRMIQGGRVIGSATPSAPAAGVVAGQGSALEGYRGPTPPAVTPPIAGGQPPVPTGAPPRPLAERSTPELLGMAGLKAGGEAVGSAAQAIRESAPVQAGVAVVGAGVEAAKAVNEEARKRSLRYLQGIPPGRVVKPAPPYQP